MPERIPGVVFVVVKDGQVLLEKRPDRKGDSFRNEIIIPGGHIDPGETAPHAVLRELREELNLRLLKCRLLGSVIYGHANKPYEAHTFLVTDFNRGELVNVEPEKGEHWWVPIEDAREKLSLEASRKIIDLARGVLVFGQDG